MLARRFAVAAIGVVFALALTSASAQAPSATAPTYKVGDEWRYTNGNVFRVVAIENDTIMTTLTPNPRCPECRYVRDAAFIVRSIIDKDGKTMPPNDEGLQTLVFPMEVGKTWV